jgi:hypothetical protein
MSFAVGVVLIMPGVAPLLPLVWWQVLWLVSEVGAAVIVALGFVSDVLVFHIFKTPGELVKLAGV